MKKVILEYDESTTTFFGRDGFYIGVADTTRIPEERHFGEYKEPDFSNMEYKPVSETTKIVSPVSHLLELKAAGFTVDEILELSDKRLI
jgi:hypothetical protein